MGIVEQVKNKFRESEKLGTVYQKTSELWDLFRGKLFILLSYVFRILPIQSNKIIASNFIGKGYGDNPKYICQELMEKYTYFDIVWILANMEDEMPKGIRKVKINSLKALYELCTAKVWIDNCRKELWTRKRKGQFYIQTWHGDIGIKKVEMDVAEKLPLIYIKKAKNDSSMADVFISGSSWASQLYRSSFWYSGAIAEYGLPRTDILYKHNESYKLAIKRSLKINDNEKIILYAPTFRSAVNDEDISVYALDWPSILKAFNQRFGGVWHGMVRLHPNVARFAEKLTLPAEILNVTDYVDMQELLFVSDCVISDYSSCIFEFAATGKLGFIFAIDYEEYKKNRDVYFELDESPFLIAKSNNELVVNILGFNEHEYQEKIQKFFGERIGVISDGNASNRCAELINKICQDGVIII